MYLFGIVKHRATTNIFVPISNISTYSYNQLVSMDLFLLRNEMTALYFSTVENSPIFTLMLKYVM